MHIVYTGEEAPASFTKSLFLAGPTPCSADVASWRPEALKFLEQAGYDGVVFVPEDRRGSARLSYDLQAEWEHKYLEMADCILFWVPRDLQTMPAFTTNIEFGWWMDSGKVVFGAPLDAPKNDYLRYCAQKFMAPQSNTIEDTITEALKIIGDGALRRDGERFVPLFIWRTRSFQAWYQAQLRASNRLDWARVEWTKRIGPERKFVYAWALHVHVFIQAEGRTKKNEIVISRPSIVSVFMYRRMPDILETPIVLVREFRSPASTPDGFIHELPSGSSPDTKLNPHEIASEEAHEETGLRINPSRLVTHESRQLAGTFSAHQATLFSVELTYDEFDWLTEQAGQVRGTGLDDPSGEKTYVEVRKLGDIVHEGLVDWSTLGMIFSVLSRNNAKFYAE